MTRSQTQTSTCTISWTFTPPTTGTHNSTDNFTVNGAAYTMTLTGTGTGAVTLDPTTLDFGAVGVGTTRTLPVIIRNTSTGPITLNLDGLDTTAGTFTATNVCQNANLAPDGTCTISWTFTPPTTGTHNATDNFTVNGAAYTMTLTGTGT